jgi:hypothetical protein
MGSWLTSRKPSAGAASGRMDGVNFSTKKAAEAQFFKL